MPKVGRLSRLDHKSLCSMFLVSLFVWAGVVATAQVDENRSLLAIKCPQCPKNRRFPSNDHSEHLPRCSSSLRNTKMSCRKGAASVFEAFPETQCTTYSCDGAVRPTSSQALLCGGVAYLWSRCLIRSKKGVAPLQELLYTGLHRVLFSFP